MGSTRRLWLVGVTCAVLLLALGVGIVVHNRPLSCTMMGPSRTLDLQIAPALQRELTTIRVRLTQGSRDQSVEFVSKPTNKYHAYVEQGVFLEKGTFHLDLGSIGRRGALVADWAADEPARVVVVGFSYSGKTVFRRAEQFRFKAFYPNGKACDKDDPGLSHTTRVAADDRL